MGLRVGYGDVDMDEQFTDVMYTYTVFCYDYFSSSCIGSLVLLNK